MLNLVKFWEIDFFPEKYAYQKKIHYRSSLGHAIKRDARVTKQDCHAIEHSGCATKRDGRLLKTLKTWNE